MSPFYSALLSFANHFPNIRESWIIPLQSMFMFLLLWGGFCTSFVTFDDAAQILIFFFFFLWLLGTGFQAQIKNIIYEYWFFQAGHWWTNMWIHEGIIKIHDKCVSSLCQFVCKFKELASSYLVINNQYLLCNTGESQDESTTFADMKRVWLSKKFSYIYEASPSTNLAFFMQSLYAHCIGTCLDSVVTIT